MGHGYIELDENTDPRFFKQTAPGTTIGQLEVRGREVVLNGQRVDRAQRISDGSHLRTGAGSWAKIHFSGKYGDACAEGIRVEDFRMGKLYGVTHRCEMRVEMPQGHASADTTRTRFHIALSNRSAEVTVVQGVARVAPPGQAAVIVRAKQEAILTPSGVSGPRGVSDAEIRERLRWISVRVPSLSNLRVEDAQSTLRASNLRPGQMRVETNDGDGVAGRIARQRPASGAVVPGGSEVDLWQWGEVPQVSVPNVAGMTLRNARTSLQRAGLRTGNVTGTGQASPKSTDIVSTQSLTGGQVPKKTRVNLVVRTSSGTSNPDARDPVEPGPHFEPRTRGGPAVFAPRRIK